MAADRNAGRRMTNRACSSPWCSGRYSAAVRVPSMAVVASMVGTVTLFGLAAICLTVPQQMSDEMRTYGANLIVTGPQGGMDDDVVRTVETQVRAAAEADAATYRYENRTRQRGIVCVGRHRRRRDARAQPALGRRRRLAERWAGIGRFGCGRSDEPADRRHRGPSDTARTMRALPATPAAEPRQRIPRQRRGADEGRPCVHRHPGNRRRRVSRGRNPGNRRQRGRHHPTRPWTTSSRWRATVDRTSSNSPHRPMTGISKPSPMRSTTANWA